MIGRLTGRVFRRSAQDLVLDVGGVGFLVSVSGTTLSKLPEDGHQAQLHIHTHVREGAIQLFGFASEAERLVFDLLLSVSGVGPRVGLSVLSQLAPEEVLAAIERGDVSRLRSVSGVGRKLAERIGLELREKIQKVAAEMLSARGGASNQDLEAASALQHLGYGAHESRRAVEDAAKRLGPGIALEALLREALLILSR